MLGKHFRLLTNLVAVEDVNQQLAELDAGPAAERTRRTGRPITTPGRDVSILARQDAPQMRYTTTKRRNSLR